MSDSRSSGSEEDGAMEEAAGAEEGATLEEDVLSFREVHAVNETSITSANAVAMNALVDFIGFFLSHLNWETSINR